MDRGGRRISNALMSSINIKGQQHSYRRRAWNRSGSALSPTGTHNCSKPARLCWIHGSTRHSCRCVQHLYVLSSIHRMSRSWQQCQAHACGMHDSYASHNSLPESTNNHCNGYIIRIYYITTVLGARLSRELGPLCDTKTTFAS